MSGVCAADTYRTVQSLGAILFWGLAFKGSLLVSTNFELAEESANLVKNLVDCLKYRVDEGSATNQYNERD